MISFGNPKYNDYRLTKYINQNLNEAMSKDYAEAMPGVVKGLTGKIILKRHHLSHLHFNWRGCKDSMKVNTSQLSQQPSPISYQPYTDKNGNTRTAVLDTAKSEGWVDNGDGTVSKTFTAVANDNPATYHIDLMTQIKNSSYLYLKFPDLVLRRIKR